ncbi:MAG: redoxin domain-containing protein, partial [Alphaproteobacteria bacterium]
MKRERLLAVSAVALLVGLWGIGGGASVASAAAGQKVDNFELTDQNLLGHSLYSMADAKAIVLITQGNGCPVVRNNAIAYNALKAAYAGKGVEFLMLNANSQDSREDILKEAAEFHYDFPILQDTNQLVGEQLHVERTGEVFVIDPKTWTVVFRGPIDDRVTYERQKSAPTKTYAKDALDAFLAGRQLKTARVDAPGCIINLLQAKEDFTKISYAKDIAPIIQDKCVTCHQPGGIGPMTLTSYSDVRGHSTMIREVVRVQRMPPFAAEPGIGHFKNDKRLTPDQIKTLVHWIESGSPRGTGADPLAAQQFAAKDWPLGTPDVVLDIPAFTIKANGVVDYQSPWAAMPADFEGRWLRASTIKVDQRQGVHHVLTGYMDHAPASGDATRGGSIEWKMFPAERIAGRAVLVIDDILDEGHTLVEIRRRVLEAGAGSFRAAVFADKDIGKKKPIAADFTGITLP